MTDREGQVWELLDDNLPMMTIIILQTMGICPPDQSTLEAWKHRALCVETGTVSTWWEPVDFLYESRDDRRRLA